ncbi:MAG: fibronectin type III domain-containing protein, partial [Bacteroidales bacterium]|nr:fibronectin type III domain-containing protein [Bacteroidales bacterium]
SLNNPLWLNLPVLSTGVSRGKARLSFQVSAWSAANPTQAATFGATDTLWVLFSTDNKFNGTTAKIKADWSEVTPQGKTYTVDFDVKESYQYWAVYTGLQTAGNVLFIDSLNIEWTEIYCDAATRLRESSSSRSANLAWTAEGEEYGIAYTIRKTDKWDTVYTHETSYTLTDLLPGTPYQYFIIVYCDAERQKASGNSAYSYFQTEVECSVPTIEIVKGSETWQGVTVITQSDDEKTRQFYINANDRERYPGGWYAFNRA